MTREERIDFNHQLLKQSVCSIHRAVNILYWDVVHDELSKDVKQYKEICETLRKLSCELSEMSNKICDLDKPYLHLVNEYDYRFDKDLNLYVSPKNKNKYTKLEIKEFEDK